LVLALYSWFVLAAIRAPGLSDDTSYHLPIARSLLEYNALVPQPFLRFPFFPHAMELLFGVGLMLGGDLGAQTIATIPLFVMTLGLLGASRQWTGSILPGFLASFAMLKLDPVSDVLGYAYVDNGLALFCLGAFLAVALWEDDDRRSSGWLLVSGLLAGLAISCKYFGLVPAGLIGLWLLLVRHNWRAALVYGGTAFLVGAGWYIRNWILTGDPVHPVGGPVFGYYLWDAQDLVGQKEEQATHGVAKQIINLWPALSKAGAATFGLALLWIVFAWRASRPVRMLYAFFLAYLLFWFYATQVDRYLAPIFAIGSLLAAFFVWETVTIMLWPLRRWDPFQGAPNWIAPLLCLVLMGNFLLPAKVAAQARLAGWQDDIDRRSGYWLVMRANRLSEQYGPRMFQLGFGSGIYFFKGTAIGDWFGPGRYRDMVDSSQRWRLRPANAIKAQMNRFNSRILLVNTEFVDVDLKDLRQEFDVQLQTRQGVLLTLKQPRKLP
jgi:4-amino-4-deoxy-L-arabinose transferase-like glycosyltransferase